MITRFKLALALGALCVLVLVVYAPAFQFGFYGDDWIFFDLAGRLNLNEYLGKYFDPHAQTAWYRPVQGVLWRIGYATFGHNPLGYHAVNIFLHLANVLLLFALVKRETKNERVGFVAALIFATLPTAALAVFWAGVVDPLETFFYLTTVWFWLAYLRDERARDFLFAFIAFLLALFSKEIGVTLPATLFLLDRFWLARPASLAQLARRYALFAVTLVPFAGIEWIVTRRSVFVNREGYAPGAQIAQNLADYFSALAFPWGFFPPLSYAWLALVALALAFLIFARKRSALVPLVVGAAMAIAPVAPFPFVAPRFLYLSLVAFAVVFALTFDAFARRSRVIAFGLLALVVAWGGVDIAGQATRYAEDGRVARVPFRNVRQAHPSLPDDTYFYFIHPPAPGPNLSGMFFWQYGARVFAGANDSGYPANLRDHAHAYIIYWDAAGNQKEQAVEKDLAAHIALPPALSAGSLQFAGFELGRANLKRGEPILGLLYLRATADLATEINVEARLFHRPTGRAVAVESQTIHGLDKLGALVIAPIQFPLHLEPGSYRLQISVTTLAEPIVVDPLVIAD